MGLIIIIIALIAVIEIELKPRLDKTKEGDVLLWYGKTKRDYKKLGKFN